MATIVAKRCPQMVFRPTLLAMRREFSAGHGHERPVSALDDFQVADDEAIVESDGAKRLQPFATFLHQLDADFSDFHGCSPCKMHAAPFLRGKNLGENRF